MFIAWRSCTSSALPADKYWDIDRLTARFPAGSMAIAVTLLTILCAFCCSSEAASKGTRKESKKSRLRADLFMRLLQRAAGNSTRSADKSILLTHPYTHFRQVRTAISGVVVACGIIPRNCHRIAPATQGLHAVPSYDLRDRPCHYWGHHHRLLGFCAEPRHDYRTTHYRGTDRAIEVVADRRPGR